MSGDEVVVVSRTWVGRDQMDQSAAPLWDSLTLPHGVHFVEWVGG